MEDAGLPYTVKLEGARNVGYRSMFMGYFVQLLEEVLQLSDQNRILKYP